ncbi:MAG: hypothetical protein LBS05_05740 [Tannerellaceae bacterium]|jgi:hypothetical protein|nr:hypothetical protein [Tannerellaceae bacterium]
MTTRKQTLIMWVCVAPILCAIISFVTDHIKTGFFLALIPAILLQFPGIFAPIVKLIEIFVPDENEKSIDKKISKAKGKISKIEDKKTKLQERIKGKERDIVELYVRKLEILCSKEKNLEWGALKDEYIKRIMETFREIKIRKPSYKIYVDCGDYAFSKELYDKAERNYMLCKEFYAYKNSLDTQAIIDGKIKMIRYIRGRISIDPEEII